MKSLAATLLLLSSSSALAAKKHTKKIDTTEVLHKGPATYSCPPGFDLHGKKCSRILENPKVPFCSIGILEDGKCVDFRPTEQICPPGFTQTGEGCSHQNTAERIAICPTGYRLGDSKDVGISTITGSYGKKKGATPIAITSECIREVTVPLVYFCPDGFTNSGHQCIATKGLEPLYYCDQKGYTLMGDRCTTTTHYDCSPDVPAPLVQDQIGSIGFGFKHLRVLGKKVKHKPMTPTFAKQAPPQKEHFIVSQKCKKFEDVPALKKCPPNSVPDGKACIVTKVVDKLPKCPAMGSIDYCYDIEAVPANYICPPGFEDTSLFGLDMKKQSFGGLGECVSTDFAPLKLVCGHDFVQIGDRCATYYPVEYYCEGGEAKHGGKKHGGDIKHGHGKSLNRDLDCTYLDYAEPIVTYAVKYACTGKDCHPGEYSHGHGHH